MLPSGHPEPALSPEYTIRSAQTADLDRLVELVLALQDHIEGSNPDLWRMKPEARAHLRGQLSSRLKASDCCALVAENREDGVVGLIFGRVTTNKRYIPKRVGVVDQIFVRVDHRRAGVGSRLVAGLCGYFADRDVEDLSLRYVVGNEEAAAFWTALGFAPRIVVAGAGRAAVEVWLSSIEGS
jgi:GNAT superfamily N-acetyltransferase